MKVHAKNRAVPGERRVIHNAHLYGRLRNYQVLATVLLTLVAILVVAEVYHRSTDKVQIHVVEVDHLGNVRGIGPARTVDTADPRLVRAQLVEWVRLARTVSLDSKIQDLYVRSATARTAGLARAVLNEHLRARNPFKTALRSLVEIRDVTALAIEGTDGWEVQWTERERGTRSGRLERQARWRAIVSFRFEAPESEESETNPLGFHITHLSWTFLGDQEINAGGSPP